MAKQGISGFKIRELIIAVMVATGSMVTIASAATASTLKISIENLGPINGHGFTPVWFAFHDGSFNTFDVGAPASLGLEHVAEDGVSGLENTIPGLSEGLAGIGVNVNNPPIPVNETISVEFANSSTGMNGGVQSVLFGSNIPVPIIFPGQTATSTIELYGNPSNYRYFNYASLVFPSNDAFIANDKPIKIFDAEGNFIGADFIVFGNQVLDAGTEVNDENPSYIDFTFDAVGKGVDENGTVQFHPGLKSPSSGGILDYEFPGGVRLFANADFKAPGYQVARIRVTKVPEPATTAVLLLALGLFTLGRRVRPSVLSNLNENHT